MLASFTLFDTYFGCMYVVHCVIHVIQPKLQLLFLDTVTFSSAVLYSFANKYCRKSSVHNIVSMFFFLLKLKLDLNDQHYFFCIRNFRKRIR